MSLTKPPDTFIPDRICSLRVLLVEADKNSLQHHQYTLLQNLHRVTPTTKASVGVSMILNGDRYDCVVVDAETCEVNMVDFLRIILKHHERLSIIVMASIDIQMYLARAAHGCEAIWFLLKPCGVANICNILQHICKKKLQLEEDAANRKSRQLNIVHRVDPMVNRPPIFNTTTINNNISSGNVHHGLNINSREHGVMNKPITYMEISSDDDEPTTKDTNKGKQSMNLNRKHNLLVYHERGNEFKRRFNWTPDIDAKFMEALIALGTEKAYPNEILKHMNVRGLTRYLVTKRLEIYQEKQNNRMKSVVGATSMQEANNNASTIQSNSLRRLLNSSGISLMNINNIKARLQGVPLPQISTTAVNNSSFRDQLPPLIDDKSMRSGFELAENPYSGIGQGNEDQMPIYDSRNQMQPPITSQVFLYQELGEALMVPRTVGATIESQYNIGTNANNSRNQMQPLETSENFSRNGYGEAMAFPSVGVTMESQYNVGTSANNFGNEKTQPLETNENFSHNGFGQAMAGVGVTIESQYNIGMNANNFGNQMQAMLTSENISQHGFGEAMTFNNFGNQMQAPLTSENISQHGFGKAMAFNNNGNQMQPLLTSENFSQNGFGEAMAFPGVDATTESQSNMGMNANNFGNQMQPMLTSENISQHGFGEAMAFSGVGATTESQYNIGPDANRLVNELQALVTSGNFSQNGFGEELAPAGVGTPTESQYNIETINADNFVNEMLLSLTSDHAFGETMAPSGGCANVKYYSDYNIGTNVNDFSNEFDHGNSGGGGGSGNGVNEVLEPYDRFGIAIEPWATGGADLPASSNGGF